jgi:hypothetical protein
MHRLFFLLFLFFTANAYCQVVNDNIENRLFLKVDALPFHSNTTNCTVQWKCVDTKAVTGCIKFHNDQWFEFTTRDAGRYYLSVANQQCRDVRGVQVLVIDGTPCEPATYKHIICYSTGAQDDISLILDNLQANYKYLINIDGYLNDFCGFDIAVSAKAPEVTLFTPSAVVPVQAQLLDSLVHLQWTLPDSLQEDLTEFYILRRHASEKRSQEIVHLAAIANAYGNRQSTYAYTDTVAKKGVYTYKIIGSSNQQQQFLLKELNLYFEGSRKNASNTQHIVTIDIPVRRKLNLSVLIFDAQTNELLRKSYMLTSAKHKNQLAIDVAGFVAEGIYRYRVMVREIDNPQGYEKNFYINR